MMCAHCEAEGELYVRIPRQPSQNLSYDVNDPSTYLDIIAFDPKGAYLKLKPGDVINGDVICFGYLRRVRANRIWIEQNTLASGNRKIGRVSIKNGQLIVDFSVFKANLITKTEEEMRKVLKKQKIREGTYLETDCSVDIEVVGAGLRHSGVPRKRSKSRK